jgi:hypothetical protein
MGHPSGTRPALRSRGRGRQEFCFCLVFSAFSAGIQSRSAVLRRNRLVQIQIRGRGIGRQQLAIFLSGPPSGKTRPKPVALEKRTSVAKAVKARLFTARLKPCPSLDGLCPGLLGSPKASCTGQIGQCEKSNLEFSPAPAVCSRAMNSNCQRSAHLQRDALGAPLFIAHQSSFGAGSRRHGKRGSVLSRTGPVAEAALEDEFLPRQ